MSADFGVKMQVGSTVAIFINALNSTFGVQIDGMDVLPDNFYNKEVFAEILAKYGKR